MIKDFLDSGIQLVAFDYAWLRDSYRNWNFPTLFATYWRLWWNTAPGATIRCGTQTEPLVPDSLYIVQPNVDVQTTHQGDCYQFFLHFQIRHPYRLLGPPILVLPLTETRRERMQRIIAVHRRGAAGHAELSMLLQAFLQCLVADVTDRYISFRGVDDRLLSALHYMEQHLQRPITNAALADWVHLHPQSLLRLFKRELGQSPQAYLKQLRVDRARWLLQMTNDSIESVAAATGFCDRYHLTKVFAQVTGQTPARFRRNT